MLFSCFCENWKEDLTKMMRSLILKLNDKTIFLFMFILGKLHFFSYLN